MRRYIRLVDNGSQERGKVRNGWLSATLTYISTMPFASRTHTPGLPKEAWKDFAAFKKQLIQLGCLRRTASALDTSNCGKTWALLCIFQLQSI